MKTNEIRSKFLEFFKQKDHSVIPSASVVPQDDPTVLFTTAGMQPLVPYLMGEEHPQGHRLANSQKCIRTNDIDEVGDDSHLTFFEMLGNWSLGDYFKQESIQWSYELLTDKKWLGIDPSKLYITVYEGDDHVPKDEDSIKYWQEQFKKNDIVAKEGERIKAMGKEDNWWQLGETGPAGPDTEIFYYKGNDDNPNFDPDDDDNFVEIWNNVFMTYQGEGDGHYVELDQQNVDTGMGLERIAAVMQGVDSVFETDIFAQILNEIDNLPRQGEGEETESGRRIMADHMRSAVIMVGDGVTPSNTGQGYVLRRLIRRAVVKAEEMGVRNFSEKLAEFIIHLYKDHFTELAEQKDEITSTISKEESVFRQTLKKGLKEFNKKVVDVKEEVRIFQDGTIEPNAHNVGEEKDYEKVFLGVLRGKDVFELYDTYGFPKELSIEQALERDDVIIDPDWEKDFQYEMEMQRARSRSASKGQFKGGLAGSEDIHKKYHTATHLMYRALREILGDHVLQRGSNINDERLRFDFEHPQKVTKEEQAKIEDWVNGKIDKDLSVSWEEMPTSEALKKGAYGAFGDKYGDTVKVYSMKDDDGKAYSFEICGGPHVDKTSELAEGGKKFKIIKEQSSSAGVRRIKAVLK